MKSSDSKTTILYFSATGNSLYIAKSFGGEICSIPQMVKEENYTFKNEKIGIVFPIYSWAVNSFVLDFIKKATFDCDYLFAVGTFGIFSAGFAQHLQSFAKEYNIHFDYINKVKMVDNYLLGFKMSSQIKNEHKKHIHQQFAKIKEDVENSKKYILQENFLCKKATAVMAKGTLKKASTPNENRGIKKSIKITDSCTKCGVCTRVCPVGNIKIDSTTGKIQLEDRCFSCFSCIQNCPSNAIHLKMQMDKSRFRNKNVSLAEIIQSNNQN